MKKIVKYVLLFFLAIYVVIAAFVVICLLNYNDIGVTVLGDKTLIIVADEEMEPNYKKGDLIVVNKVKNKNVNVDDTIFFYETHYGVTEIAMANVVEKEDVTPFESTYTVQGDYKFSSEYLIGSTESSKVYHSVGGILKVLESKWGFLFMIILPILFIFMYEVYAIVLEIKKNLKEISE